MLRLRFPFTNLICCEPANQFPNSEQLSSLAGKLSCGVGSHSSGNMGSINRWYHAVMPGARGQGWLPFPGADDEQTSELQSPKLASDTLPCPAPAVQIGTSRLYCSPTH